MTQFNKSLDLTFIVPGKPVPKGRPRVTKRGHAYTPKRTKDYEAHVKQHALMARASARQRKAVGQCAVTIEVRKAHHAADLDNIGKAILDACNDILYEDDKQVTDLHIYKADGEAGVTVTVRVI